MKKLSMDGLSQSEIDLAIDEVSTKNQIYLLCKDKKYLESSFIMMPISVYKELIDFDDGR